MRRRRAQQRRAEISVNVDRIAVNLRRSKQPCPQTRQRLRAFATSSSGGNTSSDSLSPCAIFARGNLHRACTKGIHLKKNQIPVTAITRGKHQRPTAQQPMQIRDHHLPSHRMDAQPEKMPPPMFVKEQPGQHRKQQHERKNRHHIRSVAGACREKNNVA